MPDGFAGRRVLITGGLGFLGCRLAFRLAAENAILTLVDLPSELSVIDRCRLGAAAQTANYVSCDIRDSESLRPRLTGQEIVFWLAAHGGHLASMQDPLLDLDVNYRSVVAAAEHCRRHNSTVRFVFTSTRQVYGRPQTNPVSESHPTRPPDANGVHKLAAEHFLRICSEVYGLPTVSLRLTNVYGPGMTLDDPEQGVAGVLLGQALRGEPMTLFGGEQLREFTYVDDVVEALIRAAKLPAPRGEAYNVGAAQPHSLREFAQAVAAIVPARVGIVPFPAERKAIDVGDVVCDSTRFRQATGWQPATPLDVGLRLTIDERQRTR